MLNGLYSAASGMLAQQTRMDVLANDLANVDTTGYKQARIGFRDLIYNTEQGMRIGAGSAIVDAGRNEAAGAFQATGDPLSLAIAGPGYFQVRRGDGSLALTRSGDFTTNAKGEMVTQSGERLVPPIKLPAGADPDSVAVSADGTVRAGQTRIGKITLVTVTNTAGLTALGNNLFAATPASGQPHAISDSQIQQGYLEASNVDLAQTMVALIDAQRSFEMDSRAIQNQDQMMQVANQIRQ
jgi:flagellar basal-body rod protein FlgG